MGFPMGPGTLHQHNQPEEDLHLRSETSNYILVATSDHDSLVSTVLWYLSCVKFVFRKVCKLEFSQIGKLLQKIARLKRQKKLSWVSCAANFFVCRMKLLLMTIEAFPTPSATLQGSKVAKKLRLGQGRLKICSTRSRCSWLLESRRFKKASNQEQSLKHDSTT